MSKTTYTITRRILAVWLTIGGFIAAFITISGFACAVF